MAISDSQYNECCDHIDKMFSSLIIKRIREYREYIIMVNSALIGETMFGTFKPIFQSAFYHDEVTSVHFSFNNIPENSPLLTIKGLDAAYNEIPQKFARYIIAELPEVSHYEREHFNECLQYAAMQSPGVQVDDVKKMIQTAIDEYQSLFDDSSTYNEKNSVLLKINRLYNTTRNANKLSQFVKGKQQKPTESNLSSTEKTVFSAGRKVPLVDLDEPAKPKSVTSITELDSPVKPKPVRAKLRTRKVSISLSSLFGLFAGCGLILWGIVTNNSSYRVFFDVNSLIFVLGGTVACTMLSYHGLYIVRALREIVQIFSPTHVSPSLLLQDVETLIKWSQRVRVHQQERRSFRQLEEQFSNHIDPDAAFTQTAIGYLLENYAREQLMFMLNNLVSTMFDRSQVQVRIIQTMGNIALVFGFIGTIIGIIILFSNAPQRMHEFMTLVASSLIPTLYGFILAYLIFKPAARKLEQKNEMRRFRNQLLSQGFILLSENHSTIEIQDHLNSFLDPERHFHIVSRS